MRLLWFNLATDADDPILGFAASWICAVAQRVESIHVITMRGGRINLPENVYLYSVGKEKGYSEARRTLEFYRHLLRILGDNRIDACFSHMIPIFTVLAAPVLKWNRIPIVTWYAHPSLTLTSRVAHHLSDRMVTSVRSAYPYKQDGLAVIGQAIDTDLFSPAETPPDDPALVLCVGRFSPVKDHPTLLKAARLLKERIERPFRVVLLGGPALAQDEDYVAELEQMADKLELRDCVEFHPAVTMQELPSWYRRCTVHVNLTPKGFADKVVWEAMACGRLCVAASEGFRETLGRYAGHLLFEYGIPDSLADRLQWVLSLKNQKRRAMGAYLRDQVVNLHGLDQLGDKLDSIVRALDSWSRRQKE